MILYEREKERNWVMYERERDIERKRNTQRERKESFGDI